MIDGIYLAKYDRVLVKDQTDKTQNGIYVVASIGSTEHLDKSYRFRFKLRSKTSNYCVCRIRDNLFRYKF